MTKESTPQKTASFSSLTSSSTSSKKSDDLKKASHSCENLALPNSRSVVKFHGQFFLENYAVIFNVTDFMSK